MKSFELSVEELKLRLPAIMRVAEKIVSGGEQKANNGAQEIEKGTKQVPTQFLPPSTT